MRILLVYMIPVRPAPPPPPPPNGSPPLWCGAVVGCFPPPPPPVLWCGCGLLPPSLWCGVVRVWALVVPPFPPCGVVWVGWFPPACLDLLGVFGKPMLMMILMMMMMTIIMIIIITIILVFLWLVVGYLLPTCLLTIILCDSCRFGAIGIELQWANCHRDRACQGTRSA